MSDQAILHIRQKTLAAGRYEIELRLRSAGQPNMEAQATIDFALSPQEQEDLRWYMEDYLQHADTTPAVQVQQVEANMHQRGIELYDKVLAANQNTQAIWFAVRNQLADLRIEISSAVAEAAAVPWELMRDAQSDSAIALRAKEFVRVQSNPNTSFVRARAAEDGRIRLLYVVCRPNGMNDVELRAIANRLLQGLGANRSHFDIHALRPPTYEQLQRELAAAKAQKRPYHIVHFDGHGCYADLSNSTLADWLPPQCSLTLGGKSSGKHGYLLFEHLDSAEKMRPVAGDELGKLLHDNEVPLLVLNACQSAMHDASEKAADADNVHEEIRAIGSLAQAVADCGIPTVLGMRYSVYVVTAAQYIAELYSGLSQGLSFGRAASAARKHLQLNPDRWIGLQPRPLQDWFVPVIYEAAPLHLAGEQPSTLAPELDPVQRDPSLLRYVPDSGFVGRDETLLLLDRAFDKQRIVLLHAYAGQGKSSTAVEFARWYAETGGLGAEPPVLLTSFEYRTTLDDALNQVGRLFAPLFEANRIDWLAVNERQKRRELIVQVLRQIPLLWIWDNVEPVAGFPQGSASMWSAEEQRELADFLKQIKLDKTSRAKLLLTSRRDEQGWLGGIPFRIAMPRMSSTDAAKLVLELGEERQMQRHELGAWQPLLSYCAGNPMTLRVVAMQAIKSGLRTKEQIGAFIQALRDGEQSITDEDAEQGRDRSLAASLAYGFADSFTKEEMPVIALLHLFQGVVDVDALVAMGKVEGALDKLQGKDKKQLAELLERAAAIGLLTLIGDTWYSIHPALPWFLRLAFQQHYGGSTGRGDAALRAWAEAMGALGNYYHWQFNEGNREVIRLLDLEQVNLLHARRLARQHGWWDALIGTMQGLKMLYEYQGRGSEWAQLVTEIVPDYCTVDDMPVAGREEGYTPVMSYRVRLALDQDRDLDLAAALQNKLVILPRQQAAEALALPVNMALTAAQCNRIRSLGVGVFTLGQILRKQGSADCVAAYREDIGYAQRIGDRAGEAIDHYNLGHAYKDIPTIRDLDAAEAAYQQSLQLRDSQDALGRSRCIAQIGMVHSKRFDEARQRGEAQEILLRHAHAAESCYRQALKLCPASAITDLAPMHNSLGSLYRQVGQIDLAREHYELAAHYFDDAGDRYHAGGVRYNLSLMYEQLGLATENPQSRHDLLHRARAYAQAALSDYQSYQGRVAEYEAQAQRQINDIEQALAASP